MKLNRNGSNGKAKALFAHAIAAALVAALAGPVVAWGVTELEYDPAGTGAGLTDNPTHVEVYKLEKGNTNFVEGAKMRITRKDTGEVVASWTTGKTAYEFLVQYNAMDKRSFNEKFAENRGYHKSGIEFRYKDYDHGEMRIDLGDLELGGRTSVADALILVDHSEVLSFLLTSASIASVVTLICADVE